MKSVSLLTAAVALSLVWLAAGSARAEKSSTRTNVCISGFCADVSAVIRGRNRYTQIVLRSWPRSDHRNLRCPDGYQIKTDHVQERICLGRYIMVQACTKPTFGTSRCGAWVTFQ